jgi:hypothetical protein
MATKEQVKQLMSRIDDAVFLDGEDDVRGCLAPILELLTDTQLEQANKLVADFEAR